MKNRKESEGSSGATDKGDPVDVNKTRSDEEGRKQAKDCLKGMPRI